MFIISCLVFLLLIIMERNGILTCNFQKDKLRYIFSKYFSNHFFVNSTCRIVPTSSKWSLVRWNKRHKQSDIIPNTKDIVSLLHGMILSLIWNTATVYMIIFALLRSFTLANSFVPSLICPDSVNWLLLISRVLLI